MFRWIFHNLNIGWVVMAPIDVWLPTTRSVLNSIYPFHIATFPLAFARISSSLSCGWGVVWIYTVWSMQHGGTLKLATKGCYVEGNLHSYITRAWRNLEVGVDVQPNTSRLEAVYVHSLIINPYRGMYQEIHPCWPGSIGSVKLNTSLLMMREWCIITYRAPGKD